MKLITCYIYVNFGEIAYSNHVAKTSDPKTFDPKNRISSGSKAFATKDSSFLELKHLATHKRRSVLIVEAGIY